MQASAWHLLHALRSVRDLLLDPLEARKQLVAHLGDGAAHHLLHARQALLQLLQGDPAKASPSKVVQCESACERCGQPKEDTSHPWAFLTRK